VQARTVIVFIIFCSLFVAGPCLAHKVRIFAWSEGNIIHTEAKFSGGKAAQNSTVTVIESSTGKELLHGKTDSQGLFQFPTPNTDSPKLDIVISSGDGHKNSWSYELAPSSGKTSVLPKKSVVASKENTESSTSALLSEQQLTTIMDSLLEAKLAPIRRQLAEQQEHTPSFQDILGGIGYILGLAGIAAYMKSKKK